jgi:rSAM/selenodomain-associated transferase 2
MPPELSIIIPTLNEAAALPVLLDQLRRQEGVDCEILAADGGSDDATLELARQAGARAVAAPRGRGAQMNAGARVARGQYLLFLHADSELQSTLQLREALDALKARVAIEGPRCAGHFALRFVRSGPGHGLFYRYLEEKTALNRPGTINGDQGLLLPAEYFRELGGFDQRLPFLEDPDIADRIFASGRWHLLPGRLLTSARRFESEGAGRRYTVMALIMGLRAAGAHEYFAQAAAGHAGRSQDGPLRVGDHLALAWRVLRQAGWRRAMGIVYRAGRYSRQNSWQPFFWCDVALHRGPGPVRTRWLRFHDRVIWPLTDNRLFDLLVAIGIAAWFLGVLPLAYAMADGMSSRRVTTGGRAD